MNSLDFVTIEVLYLLAALVVILMVGILILRRRRSSIGHGHDRAVSTSVRYAPRKPMTEEQAALQSYLQRAFPDGAVLFRPRLASFLSVRTGRERSAAKERLARLRVDYLLCGEDGRPLFAFEIDVLRIRNDPQLQQRLVEKNHMLRSAGIRMLRFKGSLRNWPEPAVLRERVMASSYPSGFARSGFEPSGFAPSGFTASSTRPSSVGSDFGSSDVMSLTDLMGLPTPESGSWADVRKRS